MNCRTHEHRHFERILLGQSRTVPMPISGSVKYPSRFISGFEALAPASVPRACLQNLGLAELDALVTLGTRSWVSRGGQRLKLDVSEPDSTGPGSQILTFRPELEQDYPPNLSILISGGKENNCDALSNGE